MCYMNDMIRCQCIHKAYTNSHSETSKLAMHIPQSSESQQLVTGPAKTGHISAQNTHVWKIVLFLVCAYDIQVL